MTRVVYLDIVLAGNLLMNYTILWSTAKFAGFKVCHRRLLIGAAVGAVYALTVFIPQYYHYLSAVYKLPLSMLMVWCSFRPLSWRRFLMALAFFYVASFGIGGLVLGIMYFMQAGGINAYYQATMANYYFWWGIIGALIVIFMLGHFGARMFHKRRLMHNFKRPVVIKLWGKEVQLLGLVDTGNALTDPVSGYPVMVVEYQALQKLLPQQIKTFFEGEKSIDYAALSQLRDDNICIVPFQSIGRENGLLVGLRPEKVEVQTDGQVLVTNKVIVAIHKGSLTVDNGYQALLHPQMVHVA